MRAAYVHISGMGIKGRWQTADHQGSFSVALDKPGVYQLWVTGVHHQTLVLQAFIDEPRTIDLSIQLRTAQYLAEFDEVLVIGDFNKFSTASGGIKMNKRQDGTFSAVIDAKTDTVSYQLQGVQVEDPICGTQADAFDVRKNAAIFAGTSYNLVSVVKANAEPVEIVFDPKKLPRSQSEPEIRFHDPATPAAKIASLLAKIERLREPIRQAMRTQLAAGSRSFDYDPKAELAAHVKLIQDEGDPLLRHYLLLSYFDLPGNEPNVQLAQRVFDEVPPSSMTWSLIGGGPENNFRRIARAANQPDKVDRYLQQAYDTHPDEVVRAAFLDLAMRNAHDRGDANHFGRLYTRLTGDFAGTGYARRARAFAPNRSIQTGRSIPDFEFKSLDDSQVITANSLKKRVYLIDFWAVWCGPCVGEMKHLHEAYEKYKDRGLTILSISFDNSPQEVENFRKSKWPMPWLNAWLDGGFQSDLARSFEVIGLPRPILVGKDGQILAVDEELRGERLLDTLGRFLGFPNRN